MVVNKNNLLAFRWVFGFARRKSGVIGVCDFVNEEKFCRVLHCREMGAISSFPSFHIMSSMTNDGMKLKK